ncbi:MAG TPA: hypothetical protein DD670_21460 [Planctomycetaceae bacterium]|nr:hypothetical protein [Planctomycetaceae bacterium]
MSLSDAETVNRRRLFSVGDVVRVKTGVSDPDFPNNDLDGWVGKIVERIETPATVQYLVQWSERTLSRFSSEFRESCEIDDFAIDLMWLLEEDLDAAHG